MRKAQTLSINHILAAEEQKADIAKKEIIRLHRPFPNLIFGDFIKLFTIEANKILAQRKELKSKFKATSNQEFLITQLHKHFIGNQDFKGDLQKGIFLYGVNGTGKSVILMAYCNMFKHFGKNIDIRRAIDLGLIIKNRDALNAFTRKPLLIDDIGYETSEASDYKATIKPMANLLFTRYDTGAWTFATGQVPIKSKPYLDKYGKAVVSRMNSMFNGFELQGEDLRK